MTRTQGVEGARPRISGDAIRLHGDPGGSADFISVAELEVFGPVSAGGIDCGADCTETYPTGTSVTLTATPGAGSTFAGWGDACAGTSTTCTLIMDADKTVTVNWGF